MSMKMMQQIQEDHLNIQDIKSKKDKNVDEKFSHLKEKLSDIDDKLEIVLNLLASGYTVESKQIEDKCKKDDDLDTPTFIPDIDISDMDINVKEDKEENFKNVDLEQAVNALDNLFK